MPTLPESRIAGFLAPYLAGEPISEGLYRQLGLYLDLLQRWNSRTNLTAIREPEEIVQRHFGESLFTGARLRELLSAGATLLDFGSGAGFPGIPVQMLLPELSCCLAESQSKKAAFLREAVRTLGLDTEVWVARVETMPAERKFDCVTLRAVDRMEDAITAASARVSDGGLLAILGSGPGVGDAPSKLSFAEEFPIPGSHRRMLYLYRCE